MGGCTSNSTILSGGSQNKRLQIDLKFYTHDHITYVYPFRPPKTDISE